MKIARRSVILLIVLGLGVSAARAQQNSPCPGEVDDAPPPGSTACTNANTMLGIGAFSADPLIDGTGESYMDPDNNIVSLYGVYGNDESQDEVTGPAAYQHYVKGTTLAAEIQPLCHDGTVPGLTGCDDLTPNPAIVFHFIGMSNLTLEMTGGTTDAWSYYESLPGQPCSSECNNLNNMAGNPAWNQTIPFDGTTQESVLYQVYPSSNGSNMGSLVGSHVAVWNGAQEGQVLAEWDPTSAGFYSTNDCTAGVIDPECEYHRVRTALLNATGNGNTGGFTEKQVQAVFIKAADKYPHCDLKHLYCEPGFNTPDAYQMEIYLGDILRYLKCCENMTFSPRYPNLKQVFIASRIYGGYANGQGPHGTQKGDCENQEPFAYEGGFAVQRMIVAQINQAYGEPGPIDTNSGKVDYTLAPWFDWGPYLWASGSTARHDGLAWCNGTIVQPGCPTIEYDVREGDTINQNSYWGDFTHPTAMGIQKVANLLVNFMNRTAGSPWITPWIGQ